MREYDRPYVPSPAPPPFLQAKIHIGWKISNLNSRLNKEIAGKRNQLLRTREQAVQHSMGMEPFFPFPPACEGNAWVFEALPLFQLSFHWPPQDKIPSNEEVEQSSLPLSINTPIFWAIISRTAFSFCSLLHTVIVFYIFLCCRSSGIYYCFLITSFRQAAFSRLTQHNLLPNKDLFEVQLLTSPKEFHKILLFLAGVYSN